ncbi:hypothetical protein ACSHM0_004525 [Escherichia coli]|uniref:hypothetical protein n=1 Tax=Klebsiella variicola TaxID=244366 RepID=UPI000E2AB666|nr:hypothetical protein [Klebsiella variicola]SXE41088.1 Uncharacterised protein [Klebsiella variicola]
MTNLTNNLVHLSNEPFQTPKNIELKSLRTHCVSVRLNQDELQLLNKKRGDKSKGEWLRLAFLDKIPVAVPPINIEAWKSLSEISQKLNKLLIHLESKSTGGQLTKTEIFAVKRQISELRSCLTASSTSVR